MSDLNLGKQIGPLPLGAWFAVVGVGLGISYYVRRQGNNTPTVVTDTSGDPGVGMGGSGWVSTTPSTGGGSVAPATPTTNDQWGVAAINWLIAKGYPPVQADTAVRKYLNGDKLSVQEFSLMTILLAAMGVPPQGVPIQPGDPTPTPDPVTPTPTTPAPAAVSGGNWPHAFYVSDNVSLYWIHKWLQSRDRDGNPVAANQGGYPKPWWDFWHESGGWSIWTTDGTNAIVKPELGRPIILKGF